MEEWQQLPRKYIGVNNTDRVVRKDIKINMDSEQRL